MYILSADCAVRITEIRALLKFALEPTNKHSLFKHSVMNEADMGLRSVLHCLLLRACAPWIYVCAAFKAHLCPDKQIFMITTREGAVRTLFFQTRHTEKCYQIAQLRS